MEPDRDPPLLPLQGPRIMPPANIKSSPRQQARRPPQNSNPKKDVARAPVFLRPAPRDAAKTRRPIPPRRAPDPSAPTVAANKPRTRTMPTQKVSPLLPVTERKSQEEKAASRRPRKNSDNDKWDITPDGGSAGREGRQFTVANVGNNGRIYLRYVPQGTRGWLALSASRIPVREKHKLHHSAIADLGYSCPGPRSVQHTRGTHSLSLSFR